MIPTLELVPSEFVHAVWVDAEPLLEPAYGVGVDEYTLEQTRALIAEGRWHLMVVTYGDKIKGALVVHVYNRPNDRVLFVQAIGGRRSVNKDVMAQLKSYAARWGASTIECAARPSMVRLLGRVGMTPKYQVLEVEL